MRPRWVVTVVVAVAIVSILLMSAVIIIRPGSPAIAVEACGTPEGGIGSSQNITADLPPSFARGSIQAFGSNGTAVLFGGLSYYDRNHLPYDSLPALGSYSPMSADIDDLTAPTSSYFYEGGVFPVGWNGSAWLIAGQTTIGNLSEGSAIALEGGHIVNLTSLVAPYFQQQGIWIAGWNGEEWLLGGNNSQGAVLVSLRGNSVVNLTPLLSNNRPGDWIQSLGWNGSGWLVGGQGIFGSFAEGVYLNLLPASPFTSGGVLSMDWNGSSWLVGGSPLALVYVLGSSVRAAPSPTTGAAGWVNTIVAVPGQGWLVAGGTATGGQYAPFLATLSARAGTTHTVDESGCLPSAFNGGWIQYGGLAPAFGSNEVLLVGEGGTNSTTFNSHAAAVLLSVEG